MMLQERQSVLDTQVQNMMEYLRRYEAEQINALLDESRRVAAGIRRDAHERARQRMRQRFERERRRMRDAEQGAAARAATQRRLARHAREKALVEAAWQKLPDALRRRWADAAARRDWCDMALEQAFRCLPGPRIVVEHPADWKRAERDAALARLRKHYGRDAEAQADRGLAAGLRIRSDNACLDASVDGLLARRAGLEAALLLGLGAEAKHG